jgi:hypothetical protein
MLLSTILCALLFLGRATESARVTNPQDQLPRPTALCAPPKFRTWLASIAQAALMEYSAIISQRVNFFLLPLHSEKNIFLCEQGGDNANFIYLLEENLSPPASITLPAIPDTPFKIYISAYAAITSPTLHLLLLHELGHALGLQHLASDDTVMGYIFARTNEYIYYQELSFFSLTKADILELLRGEEDEFARQKILVAADKAPSTLQEQRLMLCRNE